MKRFLIGIGSFILVGLALGEIIARVFVLTSDIPRRTINENQIQKYVPNQTGYWTGGTHQWQVNKYGWPGPLPKDYDNLITVIGDSFIENLMNPDSCHQSVNLKKWIPDYNFLEASRSGVSFIEAMEISRELDSLGPKLQLIYLTDSDFDESIVQLNKMLDVTQWDADRATLIKGKVKSKGLKSVLYNWKFIFYLYRRFPLNLNGKDEEPVNRRTRDKKNKLGYYSKLLTYVKSQYNIQDKVLVFRDNTNEELISLVKSKGYSIIELDESKSPKWSFEHDSHWTCFGHEKASYQVARKLIELFRGTGSN